MPFDYGLRRTHKDWTDTHTNGRMDRQTDATNYIISLASWSIKIWFLWWSVLITSHQVRKGTKMVKCKIIFISPRFFNVVFSVMLLINSESSQAHWLCHGTVSYQHVTHIIILNNDNKYMGHEQNQLYWYLVNLYHSNFDSGIFKFVFQREIIIRVLARYSMRQN